MKNKHLPYLVGLICAILFFLSHMVNTVSAAMQSDALFSSVVMGELCTLIMLLALFPLLLEQIWYSVRRRNGEGAGAIGWMGTVLVCIAAVLALLGLILGRLEGGTVYPVVLAGEVCRVGMLLGLGLLMFAVKRWGVTVVKASALVTAITGVLTAVLLHGVLIVQLVREISQNAHTSIPQVLFLYALVQVIYILCLLLTDGVCVLLAVRTLRRLKDPARSGRLEHL